MAGIFDIVTDARKFNIQKPEGPFAGPLIIQDEVKNSPRIDRINEILSELDDDQKPLFMEQLRQQDKQRFTPSYIFEKDYQKSPYSFFSEGYDPDVETDFNPELINKEYKDFISLFIENVKKPEFNDIISSETLSPFAQEIMPSILQYENQHRGTYPRDLFDLFQNVVTKDA
jgi:hypothetical protein|tara:strand:+ start:99 stop:614 length:516 start_codon:yes stop_codon:yes gene_type:complete